MLTKVSAAGHSLSGVSVGGVYTSLLASEFDVIFDVGIAPRSFVGAKNLLLSHGHADHLGALSTLLGIRGLNGVPAPKIFLPKEISEDVACAMDALNRTQNRKLEIQYVPVSPGDEHELSPGLFARVFKTHHSVPSVGYVLFRRVKKLRPEFAGLAPEEIRDRRAAGEDLVATIERHELAYATDTLIDVLDDHPELLASKILILECTFVDERKGRQDVRAKGHIHLDEIVERASSFKNEALVLMHFSQLYRPSEVREILAARLPECMKSRVIPFLPSSGPFPG